MKEENIDNSKLESNMQDINVDSLWLISSRDKTGKHKNIYHGNFIPQIPNQLIRMYTNEEDLVLEPFAGSGTTLFECEKLNRKYIGFDINPNMINYIYDQMGLDFNKNNFYLKEEDSLSGEKIDKSLEEAFKKFNNFSKKVDFILMHPPYMDIIKFTDNKNDLSNEEDLEKFLDKFKIICENFLKFLKKDKYFAIVIGDVYKKSEVIPLSFYVMDMIKKNFNCLMKGIIIKNIEGNKGKLGSGGLWRYRAMRGGFYIFKHEYIFVFKMK